MRARSESCALVPHDGKAIKMREEDAIEKWARRIEDQVWYSHHLLRSKAIERGELTVVDDAGTAPQESCRPCQRQFGTELALTHAASKRSLPRTLATLVLTNGERLLAS